MLFSYSILLYGFVRRNILWEQHQNVSDAWCACGVFCEKNIIKFVIDLHGSLLSYKLSCFILFIENWQFKLI